jgi:GT2 family glycosyltransferase
MEAVGVIARSRWPAIDSSDRIEEDRVAKAAENGAQGPASVENADILSSTEANTASGVVRHDGHGGPAASVVIPTHARRDSLVRVLRALGEQSVPPRTFEVIVVCDGDVDGSAMACTALNPELCYSLHIIEQTNQGPAVARNRGVAEALAPLIIFLDDDVVPDVHLVESHLQAQVGEERLVTIGPLLPPPDFRLNAWGTWEERMLCKQYDAMVAGKWHATYRQFYTGNASVLKRHIVEAGGFDPTYRRAEDVELAQRLRDRGLHFTFLPAARGWHYVRRTFRSWQQMAMAYGAADVAMARAGRSEMLALAARDYHRRSPIVQIAARFCSGRPVVARAIAGSLGVLARGADVARATVLGNAVCSLIFNLRYYDGMAGALGGRRIWLALLSQTRTMVRDGSRSATRPASTEVR